jgi:hypothetical protein
LLKKDLGKFLCPLLGKRKVFWEAKQMREFFPDYNQQEHLVDEMNKLTRKSFQNAIWFILFGVILLGGMGMFAYYILAGSERSANGGTDPLGWFILVMFLLVAGGLVFAVLYGIWLILHGVYSKIKMFENYRFYICKVVDKKIEVPASRAKKQRTRYAKRHGKGKFYNTQGLYHLYVMYNDMQGKKQRIFVEDYFYNQVNAGGEFIMAKSMGGKLLLPNIFKDTAT